MASETTGVSGLAERYAAALFDLADERRILDGWLGSPAAPGDGAGEPGSAAADPQPSSVARGASQGDRGARRGRGLSPLVRDFLAVVARNRRLFAVPAMIEAFLAELAARRGEVTAEVIAAQPLSEAQLAALNEQLRRSVGSRVAIDVHVDPSLIGGLIVKLGSRMVDASIKSKLQRLQLAMKSIA